MLQWMQTTPFKNVDGIQVARGKIVKWLSEKAQLHRNSGGNKKKSTETKDKHSMADLKSIN